MRITTKITIEPKNKDMKSAKTVIKIFGHCNCFGYIQKVVAKVKIF